MTRICHLVADIGGTNARFALVAGDSWQLEHIDTYQCSDYPEFAAAIDAYLGAHPAVEVDTLCLAVAGPVEQDWFEFTNNPQWSFSRMALQKTLGKPVLVINDFTAQAYCLGTLEEEEFDWLGSTRPRGDRMRVIMGPGTGLGVAGLTAAGEVLPTEGGHVSFAPVNEHEVQVLQQFWRKFERVSIERILSGPGLRDLYWANGMLAGNPPEELTASQITAGALEGDARCLQAVRDFLDILASVAGDYALAMGALDGVYLSGGILPKLGNLLDRDRFRQRFEAKGRFEDYCAGVPLAVVDVEYAGLRGCVAALRKSILSS